MQNCHASGSSSSSSSSYSAGLVAENDGTITGLNYYADVAPVVSLFSTNSCPVTICLPSTGSTSDPDLGLIIGIKALMEDEALGWSTTIWGDLLEDRYPCLLGVTPNCQLPENRVCHIQSQKAIWTDSSLGVSDISSATDGSKIGISSNQSFNYGETSYTIDELYQEESFLTVSFTASIASVISNWGALEAGGQSLLFLNTQEVVASETYKWPITYLGWSDGG